MEQKGMFICGFCFIFGCRTPVLELGCYLFGPGLAMSGRTKKLTDPLNRATCCVLTALGLDELFKMKSNILTEFLGRVFALL